MRSELRFPANSERPIFGQVQTNARCKLRESEGGIVKTRNVERVGFFGADENGVDRMRGFDVAHSPYS